MTRYRKPAFRQPRVCACGDHGFVALTRGKVALIDAEDVPNVAPWSWNARRCGKNTYACRTEGGRRAVYMHRQITGFSGQHVDHWNRDTLDNRKSNLRPCSAAENLWNQANRRDDLPLGVRRRGRRFGAEIRHNYKRIYLGCFGSIEEASAAVDAATARLRGERFRYEHDDQGSGAGTGTPAPRLP